MQRIGPYFMAFMLLLLALPSLVNATPSCTNDWGTYSAGTGNCIGSFSITASNMLLGNILNNGDITINAGVTLTTNGFFIASGGTFTNNGVLTGGNTLYTRAPGAISGGAGVNGIDAKSFLSSYGGSGGGGYMVNQ